MSAHPDWRSLYPFMPRELNFGGQRYHYVDEGQGAVLLLVHGNPTWSFYWRNLITRLSAHYRVIAVDHIGCGLSDKPRDYSYTLAQHVANLGQLVEQLNLEDITLLAHDWGGAIGTGTALAHRERFRRFVMFNTAAFRSDRMPWRIRVCRTPLLGKLAVQGFNAFALAATYMAVEHHDRMTPEVRAGLLAPYDSWNHRQAVYRFVQDIPMSPRHASYETLLNIERGLSSLADHPWMFIWGMRDWCFSPHFLERFLEFIPHGEVHKFDDAGHYVIEDAYERIIPLVEQFLVKHRLEVGTPGSGASGL
jgi:haloalkane dehalogenase